MMLKDMFNRGGCGGLMVVLNRGRMLFFISHDGFRARLSVRYIEYGMCEGMGIVRPSSKYSGFV